MGSRTHTTRPAVTVTACPLSPCVGRPAAARRTPARGPPEASRSGLISPASVGKMSANRLPDAVSATAERPWIAGNPLCTNAWRSERDSNPRYESTPYTAFPVRRPRPTRRSLRGRLYRRPQQPPGGRPGRVSRAFVYSRTGEVSEWLMVPLSKSGVVMSHRGFESPPLRQAGFCSRQILTTAAGPGLWFPADRRHRKPG